METTFLHGWIASLGVALFATTGCAAEGDAAVGGDAPEIVADARSCEVFVDRATSSHGSHAISQMTFWLKLREARLDGDVKQVGFRYRATDANQVCQRPAYAGAPRCRDLDTWREIPATSFFGAKDYFELTLFISSDYNPSLQYEGVFFVETVKGSRYYAKPADGGNFFVNTEMVQNFDRVIGSKLYSVSQQQAPVVADRFLYLNPQSCR
jgi:hypothetical protein